MVPCAAAVQMMPARAFLALSLVVALAATSVAADCLSQYGPGCTNCATLTTNTTTGNRRLLHGGGRGGGQEHGGPGHNETHAPPALPSDFLTCTACDTTGYVLKTETRGTYTFGRCGECVWAQDGWPTDTRRSQTMQQLHWMLSLGRLSITVAHQQAFKSCLFLS